MKENFMRHAFVRSLLPGAVAVVLGPAAGTALAVPAMYYSRGFTVGLDMSPVRDRAMRLVRGRL
jgi:hypothetical protein